MRLARNTTRILIVDDDAGIRRLVAISLNRESGLKVCAAAESAGQALSILRNETIDVAIVDISLNGTNGLDLCERMSSRWPKLRVLMFSSHDKVAYVKRAFRGGARGYVVKSLDASELARAIYQVLAGKVYMSQRVSGSFSRDEIDKAQAKDDIGPERQPWWCTRKTPGH